MEAAMETLLTVCQDIERAGAVRVQMAPDLRSRFVVAVALAEQSLTTEQRALALVANYLTPGNQNVVNGDLLASLRDLLQIHVSTKGLLAELELERDVRVTNVERRQFESGDKLGAIRAWRVRTQKGLQVARTAFGQAGLGWVRS